MSNVNITDRAGRSSLHHAAYNGHSEVWSFSFYGTVSTQPAIIKDIFLVLNPASGTKCTLKIRVFFLPSPPNWFIYSFIHSLNYSSIVLYFQMLSLLMFRGANVNATDRKDRRPIHYACFMGTFHFFSPSCFHSNTTCRVLGLKLLCIYASVLLFHSFFLCWTHFLTLPKWSTKSMFIGKRYVFISPSRLYVNKPLNEYA